ncbi:MAG: hypothetical protein EU541_04525 [Promethearchaeota archaeon]|nr:MAG: hypothetical protein EU541_04525 [Candidatus Lokiarchaeota archaeon]
MKLILSRFEHKKKLKILYTIPEQNLSDDIQAYLGNVFQSHLDKNLKIDKKCYDDGSFLSFIFKVDSSWEKDVKVDLMLTLYLDEHENTHFFKPIMEKTISNLKNIPNLTKIFSVNTPHAERESYRIFGEVIKELTECFFEASKLHSTYNLGLSEVLILGEKGTGKSAIIDYLIHGKFIPQATPTLTPQIFQLIYNQTDFRVLDICCEKHLKEIFESHPIEKGKLPQAIVYVVDATKNEKEMKESVERFNYWMNFLSKEYSKDKYKTIPLLVLFNKIDLNPEFNLEKHKELFNPELSDLNIRYASISVKNGNGLENNFSWLVKGIKVTEKY